jgi:hypothetical protein
MHDGQMHAQFVSPVGAGAKPDFLPEQNRTLNRSKTGFLISIAKSDWHPALHK